MDSILIWVSRASRRNLFLFAVHADCKLETSSYKSTLLPVSTCMTNTMLLFDILLHSNTKDSSPCPKITKQPKIY